MNMPDETITKTVAESSEKPPVASSDGQSVSLNISHVLGFCALGLGICFFLPWFNMLFARPSGYDLTKAGDAYLLLWMLPLFCVLTFFAGVTKTSQKNAAYFTGILPFAIVTVGCFNLGTDLLKALEFGGYASLGFGLALIVLSLGLKQ
jgi:hypothetical protein